MNGRRSMALVGLAGSLCALAGWAFSKRRKCGPFDCAPPEAAFGFALLPFAISGIIASTALLVWDIIDSRRSPGAELNETDSSIN